MVMLRMMSFSGAWGAPSIEPECSRAQAWLRICGLVPGADYLIEDCDNPQVGQQGNLPVMELGKRLAQPAELYAALRESGLDADAGLDASQRADSTAYTALVTERLGVALLYSWWIDTENYDVIRSVYAGKLPLPLCLYLPWSIKRKVHSQVRRALARVYCGHHLPTAPSQSLSLGALAPSSLPPSRSRAPLATQLARRSCIEPETAYAHGEEALAALALRYGERPYFHGANPSGVDAAVFGYLTAVLRCPLPNDRLRQALRAQPNLVALCERMSTRFFDASSPLEEAAPQRPPLPPSSGRAVGEAEAAAAAAAAAGKPAKSSRTPKAQRFRERSRNALVAAGATALVYALATDMVGRHREDEDEDE